MVELLIPIVSVVIIILVLLRSWGRRRAPVVMQLAVPDGQARPAPAERDAWEPFWDAASSLPVDVRAEIDYLDREGRQTRRIVRVERLHPPLDGGISGGAISGWCERRQAQRTFLISRIGRFVVAQTGEVVEDVLGWLREAYAASPPGRADALLAAVQDELSVLTFIGRADGRMSPAERSAIVAFLSAQGPDVAPALIEEAVRAHDTTQAEFRRALKRVATDADRAGDLRAAVEKLRDARGRMDGFTAAAVDHALDSLNPGRNA